MDGYHPPFTTRGLGGLGGVDDRLEPSSYLPATHRTKRDHIIVPQADAEFLGDELLVKRINAIQDWLWVCGRPMPPRPLHYQIAINREIAITENPELHLIWSKKRIFLKPLPPWLLDPLFWTSHILHDADLAECARGFLFSYTALIAYESDYRLARETGLVPSSVTWEAWKGLTKEVLQNHDMARVNPRYWYGELRLNRMNLVYRFKGYILRGYSKVDSHAVYADLIADNFAALAGILGYVVIVLTSLQVGLSVSGLSDNVAFVNFSYGFTIFSIIAPVIAVVGILVVISAIFASNWLVTNKYEERRFKEMGVEPYWRTGSRRRLTTSLTRPNTSNSSAKARV
ncbi:hypothetical protein F5Y14DRAFT_331066 [Nemania sp. NC0429]|nr:hypothetical protein F5Y14DRAFT_331066 [Nemania sp. NC0429]